MTIYPALTFISLGDAARPLRAKHREFCINDEPATPFLDEFL